MAKQLNKNNPHKLKINRVMFDDDTNDPKKNVYVQRDSTSGN